MRLGLRMTLIGGTSVPQHGLRVIAPNTDPCVQAIAQLDLGLDMPELCGRTIQRGGMCVIGPGG